MCMMKINLDVHVRGTRFRRSRNYETRLEKLSEQGKRLEVEGCGCCIPSGVCLMVLMLESA
jgi:hypothetical protein